MFYFKVLTIGVVHNKISCTPDLPIAIVEFDTMKKLLLLLPLIALFSCQGNKQNPNCPQQHLDKIEITPSLHDRLSQLPDLPAFERTQLEKNVQLLQQVAPYYQAKIISCQSAVEGVMAYNVYISMDDNQQINLVHFDKEGNFLATTEVSRSIEDEFSKYYRINNCLF